MAAVSLMAKTKLLRNICFDLNRKVAAKYDCLQIFNNLFAVPGWPKMNVFFGVDFN